MLKKVKKNIFNLALGNRNSKTSVKSVERNTFNSQQATEYHTQSNSSYPSIKNGTNNTNGSAPEIKSEVKSDITQI